jgi:class 3 adenylate cyclase
MSSRLALLIGNDQYADQKLAELEAVRADLAGLQMVLEDEEIGHFDKVRVLVNERFGAIQEALAEFFMQDKSPDDLLLVYFSGHGILDRAGDLYLAVSDTKYQLPLGTSISASFVRELMHKSRSRRQVLILDCCHSGAFGRAKSALGLKVIDNKTFSSQGYALEVLTASDATQLAWEGDSVIGDPNQQSIFTRYLVEGLMSGEIGSVDSDEITVEQLYGYAHGRIVEARLDMTPQRYSYNQKGSIVIASRPRKSQLSAQDQHVQLEPPGLLNRLKRWVSVSFDKHAFARDILRRHVAPDAVDRIIRARKDFLAPAYEELTLLFVGVRGFTTISEVLAPRDTAKLVNEVLSMLTSVVYRNRGTLGKYDGFSMLAFWGAPEEDPHHASSAVHAAMQMMEGSQELNNEFLALGYPQLYLDIGITTGGTVVGNFGSRQRTDYTVMGDTVDLASRLQSMTRLYSVQILVNAATKAQTNNVVFREIDRVRVKGKSAPDTVSEPLGLQSAITEETLRELDSYNEALSLYRSQDLNAAMDRFTLLADHDPHSGLYAMYQSRISEHLANPPSDDWDGVFQFLTK